MKENMIRFDSVIFDKEKKTFTVLDGSKGTYSYKEIVRCSILSEDANYKGKTDPFVHQVLSGVTVPMAIIERSIYVGLKIKMSDGSIIAVYVSKEKTRMNTDVYFKDMEEAKKIKQLIDTIIKKYQS